MQGESFINTSSISILAVSQGALRGYVPVAPYPCSMRSLFSQSVLGRARPQLVTLRDASQRSEVGDHAGLAGATHKIGGVTRPLPTTATFVPSATPQVQEAPRLDYGSDD